MAEHNLKGKNIYANLIQKGIEQGQLDPQINPALTSHWMVSLNTSLMDYFLTQFKVIDIPAQKEELLSLVDDMLYLLANGIQKKA